MKKILMLTAICLLSVTALAAEQPVSKGQSFMLAFGMDAKGISAAQYVAANGGTLAGTPGSVAISSGAGARGSFNGVNPNFTPYTYGKK